MGQRRSSLEQAPLCEGDVAALVTDGANTVCDRFASTPELVLGLLLVVAFCFAWRARAPWRSRFFAAALVLSLPGFFALAARRADGPFAVARTAAQLARVEQTLETDARNQGCETNVTNPCEACQPIARFARARHGVCAREPAPRTALSEGDAGASRCHDDDLGCGSP